MADWILAMDGGGTKTIVALCNQDASVSWFLKGVGVNPFDQPTWRDVLSALHHEVLLRAGITTERNATEKIVAASFGLPGFGESVKTDADLQEAVNAFGHANTSLHNDVALAFEGALAGGPGVLCLAGTGAMAWGNDGTKEIRVGGWGDAFGDEGSAYWIGLEAIRKLSWILDGRHQDPEFKEAMLHHMAIAETGLSDWFYSRQHLRPEVAALSIVINTFAEAGVPTAKELLRRASDQLFVQARAAHAQLNWLAAPSFSFAGGVFKSKIIQAALRDQIAPLGTWHEPVAQPIVGALMVAGRNAGWSVSNDWLGKLKKLFLAWEKQT